MNPGTSIYYPTPNQAHRLLALDLGTTTGFAVLGGGIIHTDAIAFKRHTTKQVIETHGNQFLDFQRWIREQLSTVKPQAVIYEEVFRWAAADAARVYCGFRGLVWMNCAYLQIPVIPVGVTTVKKLWTGKGNAKKDAMMAEAIRRFPNCYSKKYMDDNEADALAILITHLEQGAPTQCTPTVTQQP